MKVALLDLRGVGVQSQRLERHAEVHGERHALPVLAVQVVAHLPEALDRTALRLGARLAVPATRERDLSIAGIYSTQQRASNTYSSFAAVSSGLVQRFGTSFPAKFIKIHQNSSFEVHNSPVLDTKFLVFNAKFMIFACRSALSPEPTGLPHPAVYRQRRQQTACDIHTRSAPPAPVSAGSTPQC